MPKTVRLILFKIFLAATSLTLAVGASEWILKFVTAKYEVPHVYSSAAVINEGLEKKLNDSRYENIYEVYRAHAGELEIISIGDSFTNGGNVSWSQSYPFQLFLKLGKKYPVSNMGLCEDTTKGNFLRLQEYFKHKKSGKKTIAIVLIGATDVFVEYGPSFDSFFEGQFKKGFFGTETISFKIEEELNFLERLKTVKMASYVFKTMKEKIVSALEFSNNDDPLNLKLKKCFIKEGKERSACFTNAYEEVKINLGDRFDPDLFRKLVKVIVTNNSEVNRSKEVRIVEDLLALSETFPGVFIYPDVTYNLVSFTLLQSRYSLKDDILPVLKKSLKDNSDFYRKYQSVGMENPASMINSIEKWNSNMDHAGVVQKEYYEKIIDLVHENKGEIIFLTYPLNYKSINSNILGLKKYKDVHVIDIFEIFSSFSKVNPGQQLIGDWEHCTPKGYEMIAASLLDKIHEIAKR